jgi:hypothetical protein
MVPGIDLLAMRFGLDAPPAGSNGTTTPVTAELYPVAAD